MDIYDRYTSKGMKLNQQTAPDLAICRNPRWWQFCHHHMFGAEMEHGTRSGRLVHVGSSNMKPNRTPPKYLHHSTICAGLYHQLEEKNARTKHNNHNKVVNRRKTPVSGDILILFAWYVIRIWPVLWSQKRILYIYDYIYIYIAYVAFPHLPSIWIMSISVLLVSLREYPRLCSYRDMIPRTKVHFGPLDDEMYPGHPVWHVGNLWKILGKSWEFLENLWKILIEMVDVPQNSRILMLV